MSNEEIRYMDWDEYYKALDRIVGSGRGYDAIKLIIDRLCSQYDILYSVADNDRNALVAINKIAKSEQTAGQKIKGIKELSEKQEHE